MTLGNPYRKEWTPLIPPLGICSGTVLVVGVPGASALEDGGVRMKMCAE